MNESEVPLAKKKKNDAESMLDTYEASNYLPLLTSMEKETAEAQLALPLDMKDLEEVENCYLKTRVFQRHNIEKPVEWHLKTFAWLKEVFFFF